MFVHGLTASRRVIGSVANHEALLRFVEAALRAHTPRMSSEDVVEYLVDLLAAKFGRFRIEWLDVYSSEEVEFPSTFDEVNLWLDLEDTITPMFIH